MGLDMYLYAEKYVCGYSFVSDEEKEAYKTIIAATGMHDVASDDSPSATVQATVAYWRKANAIHGWFVRTVQGDTDDCGTYYVDRDQLVELRDLAQEAGDLFRSGDRRAASQLLAPVGGFFFGGTDVNESWLYDMDLTVKQLNRLITSPGFKDFDYRYHSSW